MRNKATREGYEFWDKICAVQSYAFLLSPDGRRVVKTPDIGDWIDKHEAQVIVDQAQEEVNGLKVELTALREDFTGQLQDLKRERQKAWDARDAAEQRNAELVELLREVQKASRKQSWAHGYPVLFQLIDTVCAKPTESGASE